MGWRRSLGAGWSRLAGSRPRIALLAVLFTFSLTAATCSGQAATSLPSPAITDTTATSAATPTPAPESTPTPTATPAPPAPEPPGVTFPNGLASGRPGQTAVLTAHYRAGVQCSIVVHYKSGPSRARGLDPKITNGAGLISWSWFIGTNTTRGRWPIDVTCGSANGRSFINVV